MNAAKQLQFALVRHENEDRRLRPVEAFAIDVLNRLHPASERVAILRSALLDAYEHKPGGLEECARLAIAYAPFVDESHRVGLTQRGEGIRALFRTGER